MSQWIEIPHWDRYQRGNDGPWIRDWVAQLDHPDYLELSFAQRGLLHDLRLYNRVTHSRVPFDVSSLARRFQQKVRHDTLEALIHAGFIEVTGGRLSYSPPRARVSRQTDKTEQNREEQTDSADALSLTQTPEDQNPLVERLLGQIRDADTRTEAALRGFEHRLPDAAFAAALESLRHRRETGSRPLTSEARYVVAALSTMLKEGTYAR